MAEREKPNQVAVVIFWTLIGYSCVMISVGEFKAAIPTFIGANLIMAIEEIRIRRR